MPEALTQEQAQQLWEQLDAEETTGKTPEAGSAPESSESTGTATSESAATPDAAQAAPGKQAADDPYEGMSQSARDELIGLKSLVSQLQQRVRNTEGHIGGLKSQIATASTAAAQVRAAGGEAPSAAQIRDAQSDPKAFQKLREEYPEFAGAIDDVVQHRINESVAKLKPEATAPGVSRADLDGTVTELRDQIRREVRVEMKHPDWQSRVRTPEFVGWFQQQANEVRTLAGSQDPSDAIRLLDLFEESRSKRANQQQRREAQAALPSGRQSGVRVKPVEEMTPEEYWAYLDEQDRQKGK